MDTAALKFQEQEDNDTIVNIGWSLSDGFRNLDFGNEVDDIYHYVTPSDLTVFKSCFDTNMPQRTFQHSGRYGGMVILHYLNEEDDYDFEQIPPYWDLYTDFCNRGSCGVSSGEAGVQNQVCSSCRAGIR